MARSYILDYVVWVSSFVGSVMLLNLLIAMLMARYAAVDEVSQLEVNYKRVAESFNAKREIQLMPPPFVVLTYAFLAVLIVIDLLLTLFTAKTKMLNDWFFTPLNKKVFSAGDFIEYDKDEEGNVKEGYVQHCYTSEKAVVQVCFENECEFVGMLRF